MSTGMRTGDGASLPRTLIFLIPRLARGGMFSVLSETWKRRPGERIRIISQDLNALDAPYPTLTVPHAMGDPLRFPGAWIYSYRIFRLARRTIRDGPPNSVLVPQDSIATGFAATLAGRLTRTPVIVMDHGSAIVIRTDFFWRERLSRHSLSERLRQPLLRASLILMNWLTCRLLTRAFLPSQEAVDRFIADGVARDRVFRYHVPIDLERFRPAEGTERDRLRQVYGLPRDRVIAVTVSRLTPEKGLDIVVAAVAAVPLETRPHLVIGGVGPLREQLERQADRLGVTVTFSGDVPADELPDLLRCADLFTYASRQGTNVPVGVLEAMASGLIVIGTPQPPALVEMLAEGRGSIVR
ncbi:MAG: glycosyltransferase family 4 protein, partial [Candidatus Limnocylindria bacterium]